MNRIAGARHTDGGRSRRADGDSDDEADPRGGDGVELYEHQCAVRGCLPNLKVVQQLKQVRQGARLVSREGSPLLPAQPQGGAAAQTGAPGCPPGLEGGESTAACPKTLSLTSHTRYPLCLLSLPPAYSEAKVANRDGTDFGGGSLTRPFRDARRFPSPRS
jgi:hypothetical protein